MNKPTASNANAYALTFAFAPSQESNASKVKRECKQPHRDSAVTYTTTADSTRTDERRATDNMVLPKWRQKCYYEAFVQGSTVVIL